MPASAEPPVILWFRNDLRLSDHAALHAASETHRPILPIFILDDAAAGRWALGGATRWWLHHSLTALRQALTERGGHLTLCRGDTVLILAQFAAQTGATDIYTGATAEPWGRRLDQAIADTVPIGLHRLRTTTLFHPDSIRSKTGGGYTVYTPFANACLALGGPKPPIPVPGSIHFASPATLDLPPAADPLDDWALLPTRPDWAGGLRHTWVPGEASAQARAHVFLSGDLSGYPAARDHPAGDGTSMLSPHLRFGEISVAQLWHLAHRHPPGRPRETLLRELLWREFCAQLLWHNPSLPDEPLKPLFARMPWRDDAAALAAWQRGRTGVPIVDAGLRQLWHLGWMHNRVRMIVASFLVKHLLLPWQEGEAWFWDTLVDADLANNAVNWQWVAGSGADASPYFRIFNPVVQGRKFDPDGDYVRQHVPELHRLDSRYIHAPWEAPAAALDGAGVVLDETYPRPIIDLGAGRVRALAAFAAIRAQS